MAAIIQQSRGDIANTWDNGQSLLANGQLFWSYVNSTPGSHKGSSYSEGQLWIKDPSSGTPILIGGKKAGEAMRYVGMLNHTDLGALGFEGADQKTQAKLANPQVGDFWVFEDDYTEWDEQSPIRRSLGQFYKNDIILITKATYEDGGSQFRQKLSECEFIRIGLSANAEGVKFEDERSDLRANGTTVEEAIIELEERLRYNGTVNTAAEFAAVDGGTGKKNGFMYLATDDFTIAAGKIITLGPDGEKSGDVTEVAAGDLIWYDKLHDVWVDIPEGACSHYKANDDEIDAVTTFTNTHKANLKACHTLEEAVHMLNISKAELGTDGKIPVSQLPDTVVGGLQYKGVWKGLSEEALEDGVLKEDAVDDNGHSEYVNTLPGEASGENSYDEDDAYPAPGDYYIVSLPLGVKNLVIDNVNGYDPIEINTGDWLVWTTNTNKGVDDVDGMGPVADTTGRWEKIDNSDRLSVLNFVSRTYASQKVEYDDTEKENDSLFDNVHGLSGDITFAATDKLEIEIQPGNKVEFKGIRLINLNPDTPVGTTGYLPVFNSKEGAVNQVTDSHIYSLEEGSGSTNDFTVGDVTHRHTSSTYGDVEIHATKTEGAGENKNSALAIFNFFNELSKERKTQVFASERDGEEEVELYLPEKSGVIVGMKTGVKLHSGYLTKSTEDGFIESAGWYEDTDYSDEPNNVEGSLNNDYGNTVSEELETGVINFYTHHSDKDNPTNPEGFSVEDDAEGPVKSRHYLNRANPGKKASLKINPKQKADEDISVLLPQNSGTLLTWEEFTNANSKYGEEQYIPVWETFEDADGIERLKLVKSPIKVDNNFDYTEDGAHKAHQFNLAASTPSYVGSEHEGSAQEADLLDANGNRTFTKDALVTYEAWIEALRSVATHEGFVLPSTAVKDDATDKCDVYTNDAVELLRAKLTVEEIKEGKFSRIVPSRTKFEDAPVYYDPFTGKLKEQEAVKTIELPAESGVLLTHNSRIDGGVFLNPASWYFDKDQILDDMGLDGEQIVVKVVPAPGMDVTDVDYGEAYTNVNN